jgi:hypothetical protein
MGQRLWRGLSTQVREVTACDTESGRRITSDMNAAVVRFEADQPTVKGGVVVAAER